MQSPVRVPHDGGIDHSLQIAGPGARSYAFVLDWHIRVLAALGWILVTTLAASGGFALAPQAGSETAFWQLVAAPSLAIYCLYHPVLEVLTHGSTPGKRIAGVRVLRRDGGVPGTPAVLVRNVFRLIDSLPLIYAVGLAATVLTRDAVRIGDMAAGTVLVYADTGHESPGEISREAVTRLGLERAELVRDLLARWSELDPDARVELGRQLLMAAGRDNARNGDEEALRGELQALLA